MALGRLANYSDDLAEAVVQNEVLPQLVRFPRKGAGSERINGALLHWGHAWHKTVASAFQRVQIDV
jgi:hypothetical protein